MSPPAGCAAVVLCVWVSPCCKQAELCRPSSQHHPSFATLHRPPTCGAWAPRHHRLPLQPCLGRLQRQLAQPVRRHLAGSADKAAAHLAGRGSVKAGTGARDALGDQLIALLQTALAARRGMVAAGVPAARWAQRRGSVGGTAQTCQPARQPRCRPLPCSGRPAACRKRRCGGCGEQGEQGHGRTCWVAAVAAAAVRRPAIHRSYPVTPLAPHPMWLWHSS